MPFLGVRPPCLRASASKHWTASAVNPLAPTATRYNHLSARGCGEIGRRARLRIWFPKGSGGSSPFIRTNPVTFDILPLRFEFDPLDTIHSPAGKAANILRGALGLTLDP